MCEVQASFTVALPKNSSRNSPPQKKSKNDVMMSFVDNLWSMEISGGIDQGSPLTVIAVRKNGLARRAGIKVGDIITHINNSPADSLTLIDARVEIQESGRSLKLTVKGDSDESSSNSNSSGEDEETANTVDFWFKPMKREQLDLLEWQRKRDEKRRTTKKLYQDTFPWNEKKKPMLRTSNCFMVNSAGKSNDDTITVTNDNNNKKEREIKLKATKERYIESEKKRLTNMENMMMRMFVEAASSSTNSTTTSK